MSYARVWDELNALNRLRLVTLSLRRYTPMNIINLIGSQIKCKRYKLLSVKKKSLYIVHCFVLFVSRPVLHVEKYVPVLSLFTFWRLHPAAVINKSLRIWLRSEFRQ